MEYLPISGFSVIEPEDAAPELAGIFEDIQRETDLPYVPIWAKVAANSPGSLVIYLNLLKAFNQHITLPQSLVPVILYCIATARNCAYCSVTNELFCRTLGVDEETLELLANDLDNVSPKRLQVIIRFAMKCAFEPQMMTEADYDAVRQEGITEDELCQIIFVTALANMNDTLADSFKIKAEPEVLKGLEGFGR